MADDKRNKELSRLAKQLNALVSELALARTENLTLRARIATLESQDG